MGEKLKPCPFCGQEDVTQGASYDSISVWCRCGAQGPSVSFSENSIDPATPIRECRQAWNHRAVNAHDELAEALRRAEQFIANGIELGFIRMPDASTPDPAHEVQGMIRAALSKIDGGTE